MAFTQGFTARCTWDGVHWMVDIPGLACSAPAPRLADAAEVARHLVAVMTGVPLEDATVQVRADIPGSLGALVATARREVEEISHAAVTQRRSLAQRLAANGLSASDIACLLGISIARAHRLLDRSRGRWARGPHRLPELVRARRSTAPVGGHAVDRALTLQDPAVPAPAGDVDLVGDAGPEPIPAPRGPLGPPHRGYRHEAAFYRGDAGFLSHALPFALDGVRLGQPVMVALPAPRLGLLREVLGDEAGDVTFVDMADLGANPSRIIPAWRRFLEVENMSGGPVRGIAEPIWASRRTEEIAECQLHEALLNIAIDPDTPFWLLCPYDLDLTDGVLSEARRSHPTMIDHHGYRGSTTYGGVHHVEEIFRSGLPEPEATPELLPFGVDTIARACDLVVQRAHEASLGPRQLQGLSDATLECALSCVAEGDGQALLRIWRDPGALTCELSCRSYVEDPLVGRRDPGLEDEVGRAIQVASRSCDLTQIRSSPNGTVVRLVSWV